MGVDFNAFIPHHLSTAEIPLLSKMLNESPEMAAARDLFYAMIPSNWYPRENRLWAVKDEGWPGPSLIGPCGFLGTIYPMWIDLYDSNTWPGFVVEGPAQRAFRHFCHGVAEVVGTSRAVYYPGGSPLQTSRIGDFLWADEKNDQGDYPVKTMTVEQLAALAEQDFGPPRPFLSPAHSAPPIHNWPPMEFHNAWYLDDFADLKSDSSSPS